MARFSLVCSIGTSVISSGFETWKGRFGKGGCQLQSQEVPSAASEFVGILFWMSSLRWFCNSSSWGKPSLPGSVFSFFSHLCALSRIVLPHSVSKKKYFLVSSQASCYHRDKAKATMPNSAHNNHSLGQSQMHSLLSERHVTGQRILLLSLWSRKKYFWFEILI